MQGDLRTITEDRERTYDEDEPPKRKRAGGAYSDDEEDRPKAKKPAVSNGKPNGAKPVAKPGSKPVAKPGAKPVAKPGAKPVAKPAAKPTNGKPSVGAKPGAGRPK